jgi:hypothetical protein
VQKLAAFYAEQRGEAEAVLTLGSLPLPGEESGPQLLQLDEPQRVHAMTGDSVGVGSMAVSSSLGAACITVLEHGESLCSASIGSCLPHFASPRILSPTVAWLCIIVPADQCECAGLFHLVSGLQANGQPVWENSKATRWLYLCHGDRWHVAGDDVKDANFVDSAGWMSQSAVARGKMPYEMETPWQRWDGPRHVLDLAVYVRKVECQGCELDTP